MTIFNACDQQSANTFVFSSIAIVFIIILGMLISYIVVRQKGVAGQLMDLLIMFPFVIPGAVLGISLIVAFNKQPVILTGTAMIMIIALSSASCLTRSVPAALPAADGCERGRGLHQPGRVPDEDLCKCKPQD